MTKKTNKPHPKDFLAYCRTVDEEEAPYELVKIPRRVKENYPNLVELRRYGDGSVKGEFIGPDITEEEESQVKKDRAERRERRLALALVRKDLREGKQKALTSYFVAKKKA